MSKTKIDIYFIVLATHTLLMVLKINKGLLKKFWLESLCQKF